MKIFADAAYYHKDVTFSSKPEDVYHEVGSESLSSRDLIQYALSVDGVSTVIIGIGHIDDDPERCQLVQNLSAAQIENALSGPEMKKIEQDLADAGKENANAYFQRRAIGLSPPRNVGAETDASMPGLRRTAVRISWDTAYAGPVPIVRYDILRGNSIVGSVPHTPQITQQRFYFDDILHKEEKDTPRQYTVQTVDASGQTASSMIMMVDQ